MGTPFRDARLKIKRSNKHIGELYGAILALEEKHLSTIEQHPETDTQTLIHEFPEIGEAFSELSLIIGDAIHNLRSALDYAWYCTINKLLPEKICDSTSFPVRPDRINLEGALHGIEIDTKCRPLYELMVSDIKPYQEGGHNQVVWTLHKLDISDKHLLALELASQAAVDGIVVKDRNGDIHRGGGASTGRSSGPWKVEFRGDVEIQKHGELSIKIVLPQAGTYKSFPVDDMLMKFSRRVLEIVESLENL